MRTITVLFSLLILSSCGAPSVAPVDQLKTDVAYLASDELEGRETGTKGEQLAADYLAQRFAALGLSPKGVEDYRQKFSYKPSTNPHEQTKVDAPSQDQGMPQGINVIGYKDNGADKTVIIGAHFDHLGWGGEGSLYRDSIPSVHNGADDNASGVALLLYLAERLKDEKNTQSNYLFIGFSGEEKGLLGSNYFAKNPTIDLASVNVMINMDMVGRLNEENTLAVHGVGTSPRFKQLLFANNDFGLNIAEHESGVGPSDHTSFYLMDLPVLHFFTGQHEDYHKPSDDADKINYPGLETIGQYIYALVTDLDDDPKLSFRKTKNESEETPRFKVGLGVIPDYLYTGTGMRIDGVSEDKPAQKAGLQKGDVVVRLGDSTVTDMMSYMRALSVFKQGDSTQATIERGAESLEFRIDF
ncbi:MAG: M28 family peptidase [Flavobacteriaceae bacterium]|jgi:Zn-dependent M28 family amino/carboxypeptidase|nr:M28 family peptidase [Flavobacteriaceae bacterium]